MRKSGIFETAAFALVACLGAAGPVAAQEGVGPGGTPPGTIRVVGEATVTAKPDLAELDLGVVTEASTAEAAAADNAKKMDRILGALKKEIGAGGEVKTVGYMVTQRLGEPKRGERNQPIVGYTVTNVVRSRIPDVKAVGKIIDLGLKNGANEVQRLVFTLKNSDPVQADALKAAAAKARTRATALAGALGLRLGSVLSVSDGNFQERPVEVDMMRARMMKMDSAAATPIETGNLKIQATVTVYFTTTPNR
jgi:uncharacterized protein YggE